MKIDYCFCLPGDPKSMEQALSVQQTMLTLMASKVIALQCAKSCNIYVARNGCLSNKASGNRKDQKPFEGMYEDYDRIIWVDSDNLISAEAVNKLIAHDVDIVAAWYRQYSKGPLGKDNKVACGKWDYKNNIVDSFKVEDMPYLRRNEKGLVEVDYSGMGLMVIKRGVIESLEYPWFCGPALNWTDENGVECSDVLTDDAYFCHRLKEKGYKIWVDPLCQILHQKLVDV